MLRLILRILSLVIFTCFLLLACVLMLFYKRYYPQFIPAYVYVLYCLALTLLLSPYLYFWQKDMRRPKLIIHALAVIAILSIHFYNDSRQTFLYDLSKIEQGMTIAQVEGIMSNRKGRTVWPTIEELPRDKNGEVVVPDSLSYKHSEESEFNADFGIILFDKGRVVKVEFIGD